MAFVPGFEHDVFISYAHANNERLIKGGEGYVTKLYEDLAHFATTSTRGSTSRWATTSPTESSA